MTTLFNRIKQDQVIAHKAHNALAASLLTTLIGETSVIGKNDGNRDVTDSEVIAVIKKFVKGMDETIGYLGDTNPLALEIVTTEKRIISIYMPQQMDEPALKQAIGLIIDDVGLNLGKVMGELKIRYTGLYDGKLASALVKDIVG